MSTTLYNGQFPGPLLRLKEGQRIVVEVADRGPGVPDEEREHIFERFHRGKATSAESGFGLGLAIGRELAERMGGSLYLDDGDAPGATFTLRLPGAHAPESDPVAVA